MPKSTLLNLPGRVLLHEKDVLAARQLLLPSLDFFLSGEGVCLHDAVDEGSKLGTRLIQFDVALEALHSQGGIVSVLFGLSSDGQLGHFGGGLISNDDLSGSTDVEGERVAREHVVKLVMKSVVGTTAVEALKAHIKTGRIVLG